MGWLKSGRERVILGLGRTLVCLGKVLPIANHTGLVRKLVVSAMLPATVWLENVAKPLREVLCGHTAYPGALFPREGRTNDRRQTLWLEQRRSQLPRFVNASR